MELDVGSSLETLISLWANPSAPRCGISAFHPKHVAGTGQKARNRQYRKMCPCIRCFGAIVSPEQPTTGQCGGAKEEGTPWWMRSVSLSQALLCWLLRITSNASTLRETGECHFCEGQTCFWPHLLHRNRWQSICDALSPSSCPSAIQPVSWQIQVPRHDRLQLAAGHQPLPLSAAH